MSKMSSAKTKSDYSIQNQSNSKYSDLFWHSATVIGLARIAFKQEQVKIPSSDVYVQNLLINAVCLPSERLARRSLISPQYVSL